MRLLLVAAGAGSGKTTLLALAREGSPLPWVWCSCDERLADPRLLLAHLAAGVADRYPGFGSHLVLDGLPEDGLIDLCNEVVEAVAEDMVIVLDDVHLLPAATAALILDLIEHLPPSVHIVLSGRRLPPLPLARLRAQGAREIDSARLALSEAEAAALVERMGGSVTDAAELHRRTEGWVAGIILASRSAAADRPGGLGQVEYLAEEVLSVVPPELEAFLVDTAVLRRVSPGLAQAVSGRADAGALLRRLVEEHLFTVRLEGAEEWYRYHHLLQQALRARLDEDPPRRRRQHRRAAAGWLAECDALEAARHLLEADEPSRAAEALEDAAEELVHTEHAETLGDLLEEIGEEHWADRPTLLFAHAMVLVARALHEAGFGRICTAVERLVDLGEHERAAAALLRLLQGMLLAGTSPTHRLALGAPLADRIAPDARLLPAARVLLATAYGYAARFREAQAELDRALAAPAAVGSPVLPILVRLARAAYVDSWIGSRDHALAGIRDAVDDLGRQGSRDARSVLPWAWALLYWMLLENGLYEEELAGGESVVERLRAWGHGTSPLTRSLPWLLGGALIGLGRFEEAASLLPPPARSTAAELPTSYAYRIRVLWAQILAQRGDAPAVRREIDLVRAEMSEFGPVFDDSTFLADLALAAGDAGLSVDAETLAREAASAARGMGLAWPLARALMVAAHGAGRDGAGDRALDEALQLTATHDLTGLWIRRERARAPRLLVRALVRGLGPAGEVERILLAGGAPLVTEALEHADEARPRARLAALLAERPEAELAVIDRLLRDPDAEVRAAARATWMRLKARPRAAIRLLSLGALVVMRDGHPVPATAFGRPKARSLLAVLLAAGGGAHRDEVLDRLWADLSPERAGAALRTTLHELRRAVEPELGSGHPDAILVADADGIRLVLGPRDSWDALELQAAAAGEPEVEALERAAALHRGPFLSEWVYEDWATPARDELEELFETVLERLARALLAAGRPLDAVSRYRVLTRRDPEREGWHRGLMRAYSAAGERALALRQYHACRAALRRTQGVEPGAETRALYQALLEEGDA